MFKKVKPTAMEMFKILGIFPHCDQRVLHAPGECTYCDKHPVWQALRQAWGIAFTGYDPEDGELPCTANFNRGDTFEAWPGNRAQVDINI